MGSSLVASTRNRVTICFLSSFTLGSLDLTWVSAGRDRETD